MSPSARKTGFESLNWTKVGLKDFDVSIFGQLAIHGLNWTKVGLKVILESELHPIYLIV